jgi:methyl-accepting chemotaxis protein
MKLNDVSLRTKLTGLALFGMAVLLVTVGAGWWGWQRLSAASLTSDAARDAGAAFAEVRLAERSWCLLFADERATELEAACGRLTGILDRPQMSGGEAVRQALAQYRSGFADLVAAQQAERAVETQMDRAIAEVQRLVDALALDLAKRQTNLQQEGEDLTADEFNLIAALRDGTAVTLRLGNHFARFQLTDDLAPLAAFEQILAKEGASARNCIITFASTKNSATSWKTKAEVIVASMTACAPLPSQARTAHARFVAAQAALDTAALSLQEAVERSRGQAGDSIRRTTVTVAWAVGGIVLIAPIILLVVSQLLVKAILRPLSGAMSLADRIAHGDFTDRAQATCQDETGRLTETLNSMAGMLSGRIGQVAKQAIVVGTDANNLSRLSERLSSAAGTTTAQAGTVRSVAQEVAAAINTVAAASSEMEASIGEIARAASEAAGAAEAGVGETAAASQTVAKLSTSSREIGDVVQLISSIAEQTNLLALNATIEAARAGDAGRGFAVVAGEVKALARQTAAATAEITSKVHGIQGDATATTEAIARISAQITRIADSQRQVATAVEEQSATTKEISGSASRAAEGGGRITEAADRLAAAATEASSGADEAQRAARGLQTTSDGLTSVVAQFQLSSS